LQRFSVRTMHKIYYKHVRPRRKHKFIKFITHVRDSTLVAESWYFFFGLLILLVLFCGQRLILD